MTNERSSSESSTNKLLARLRSPEPGKAWKQFLGVYSPVIMHIARQYEYDPGALNDCYVFICEKLSDNDFRRLLRTIQSVCLRQAGSAVNTGHPLGCTELFPARVRLKREWPPGRIVEPCKPLHSLPIPLHGCSYVSVWQFSYIIPRHLLLPGD